MDNAEEIVRDEEKLAEFWKTLNEMHCEEESETDFSSWLEADYGRYE